MRRRDRYDLVIVGMGSAGTIAAELAATHLDLRVAAVERDRIGGDCLWTGCVPSKSVLASAHAAKRARSADALGIDPRPPQVDPTTVWRRMHDVQRSIAEAEDDPDRFTAMGVELVVGDARVSGPRQVTVGERVLDARYVLLCTGSRAAIPQVEGIDEVRVHTSDDLFGPDPLPDSFVVIGGGPVGCEVGQALQRLGIPVTLVETAGRLLSRDEPRHADRLLQALIADDIDVRLGRSPVHIAPTPGGGVEVELDSGATVRAGGVFAATGREPRISSLGLAEVGVATSPDGIVVDDRNRTTVHTIYAVGDATAGRRFTHTAAYDAGFAVRDMFLPGRGRPRSVPIWCTFTDPEVAHVGLTESEAIERHGARRVEVHRHELAHSDRARAEATTDGEIAIVTHRGRVVGGHAICPHAGELIHELALAIDQRLSMRELAGMVHIYPTLSTGIGQLAAASAFQLAGRLRPLAKLGRLRP